MFFSELGPVSVAWKMCSQPTGVNRTPTQRACTDTRSVPQHIRNRLNTFHHANTRGSRAGRLRIAHLCPKITVIHVSCLILAAPDTVRKHELSLTNLSDLLDSLTNTYKTFSVRSIFTLRSFTAEWRINTNPITYRKNKTLTQCGRYL